ncbi:MAG: RNA polymerase sigma factor [Actinomycetota bacterium]|nr:RNA polymerase sigma factor [Actinomycetota bacterium]
MTERTDAELAAGLEANPADLDEFYRRHRETVVRYAVRRCAQPADVADLVAATFLAAIRSAAGFDARRGNADAWLIGIARRQWAKLCEREARQQHIGDLRLGDGLSADDIARLEERIDAARTSEDVERAIALLPGQHREVLWLIGPDGLSPSEAAAALGVSVGGFRVRLLRARRALRSALDPGAPASHRQISTNPQEAPT